ncbi:MAG TPA: hypothetical protein VHE11_16105, partial [Steroidobacteraceae bacterium]|nr:hypothetical protein [Steroidobacteraceae bacterium]
MTAHPPVGGSWLALPFAAAGLAFGWGYFGVLRRGVAAYVASGGLRPTVGRLIARLAAAAVFFTFAVHWGAGPLLAA